MKKGKYIEGEEVYMTGANGTDQFSDLRTSNNNSKKKKYKKYEKLKFSIILNTRVACKY